MFIIGIDIAKRNHEAVMIDSNGQIIGNPIRFCNSQQGYHKLMEFLRRNADDNSDIEFGMEATGHYWLALYTHLRRDGFSVNVINAIQSDALREMYIRKTKNDSRDSFIIAEVIRFGRFCKTKVESGDVLALRELCRQRFFVVDMISDLKRKVIALLDQIFPEYESLFADTFGSSSLELLSEHTSPEEILALSTDELTAILARASHGRLGLEKAIQVQMLLAIPLAFSWLRIPLASSFVSILSKSRRWRHPSRHSMMKSLAFLPRLILNLQRLPA